MTDDPSLVQALVNALEIHEKSVLASWGATIVEAHATSCCFCWALRAWRAGVPLEFHPVSKVAQDTLDRWPKCCPGCGNAKVYFHDDRWSFDPEPLQEWRGPEIRFCPFCGTRLEHLDKMLDWRANKSH